MPMEGRVVSSALLTRQRLASIAPAVRSGNVLFSQEFSHFFVGPTHFDSSEKYVEGTPQYYGCHDGALTCLGPDKDSLQEIGLVCCARLLCSDQRVPLGLVGLT